MGTAMHPGVFVEMLNSSSEAVVVTEQGTAIKTPSANVRRIRESESWVPWSKYPECAAVQWSPGFAAIQVHKWRDPWR